MLVFDNCINEALLPKSARSCKANHYSFYTLMTNTLKLNERKEKRKTSKLKLTWYYIKILKTNLRNRCIARNHAIQKKEIKKFNIIFGKASIPVDFKENLKKVTYWYKRFQSYPFWFMYIIRMFKLVHNTLQPLLLPTFFIELLLKGKAYNNRL